MNSYLVHVACEDYISVDAENESEAGDRARAVFRCNLPNIATDIIDEGEAEEQADGIPY